MYDYNKVQKLVDEWESPMLYYASCFSEVESEKMEAVGNAFAALLKKSRQDDYRDESDVPFFLLKNIRASLAVLKGIPPQKLSKSFRINEQKKHTALLDLIRTCTPAEQEILFLKFQYFRSCGEIGEITGETTESVADRFGKVMERLEEKVAK